VIDDLSPGDVERELERAGATLGRPLAIVSETASTNDDARAAAAAGAAHGATFVADCQTRGRGRGGHVWHSPPGENLYLSVVARTRVDAAHVSQMSLVVGLAVARAVERLAGVASRIKWPNDVEVNEKKIAGVLVEAQIRGGAVDALVIGIGLNVRGRAFPEHLAARATSLAIEGGEVARAPALAVVLAELGAALADFEANGLAGALGEIRARDALRGARLRAGDTEARGAGIDERGRLLVRGDDGALHPVASGSVERAPAAVPLR
jgi:BirA family transcriptional regulator, biotin operon repressor / biotin---[acetyl-CoA-carboxylase] ligase